MNVLVTSAGRRTTLVTRFVDAARSRGGRVWAGDVDGLAPALYLADAAVRLPRVLSSDYIPFLREFAARQNISLLVPTIDTELRPLSEASSSLAEVGCRALISSPGLVGITSDKWLTAKEFSARGIAVPSSWLPEGLEVASLPDRLFIKPRDGSASINAFPVDRPELSAALARVRHAIVQERLEGPEITIDALLDPLDGAPLHYVPRRRIRALAGESVVGVTLHDDALGPWLISVLEICRSLGGRGPLTLQAFLTKKGPVLTEINPRFGGGFPLAWAAGGHYPEWILDRLAGGDPVSKMGNYQRGLYMTRAYVERFLTEPLWTT